MLSSSGSTFKAKRAIGRALVAAVFASTTALVGCATQQTTPTQSPNASASPSASASPMDVDASFRAIADNSCARANADGVVEQSDDGVMFLVPEGQAYQDFSAAFDSESDGTGVIWSTEVFFVCAASIGYQMSSDGNADYPLVIDFDANASTYRTQLDVEDYGVLDYTYSVVDGAFSSVDWVSPEESGSTTIVYGQPSAELIDVLRAAVDDFLADQ